MANKRNLDNVIELLLSNELLTEEDLQRALAQQSRHGGDLHQILLDSQIVSEVNLIRAYSTVYRKPAITLKPSSLDPEVAQLLPKELCERVNAIAFRVDHAKKQLDVAFSNPRDFDGIESVRRATRYQIRELLATHSSIRNSINYCFYGDSLSRMNEQMDASATADPSMSSVAFGNAFLPNTFETSEPEQTPSAPSPIPQKSSPSSEPDLQSASLSRTGRPTRQDEPSREIQIDLETNEFRAVQAALAPDPDPSASPPPEEPRTGRIASSRHGAKASGEVQRYPIGSPPPSAEEPVEAGIFSREIVDRIMRVEESVYVSRAVLEKLLRHLVRKRLLTRNEVLAIVNVDEE